MFSVKGIICTSGVAWQSWNNFKPFPLPLQPDCTGSGALLFYTTGMYERLNSGRRQIQPCSWKWLCLEKQKVIKINQNINWHSDEWIMSYMSNGVLLPLYDASGACPSLAKGTISLSAAIPIFYHGCSLQELCFSCLLQTSPALRAPWICSKSKNTFPIAMYSQQFRVKLTF